MPGGDGAVCWGQPRLAFLVTVFSWRRPSRSGWAGRRCVPSPRSKTHHPYHDSMPTKTLMILSAVILSLALATTASAQAASYTFLNQLPPYKNPNPAMLTALTLPKIGTKLRLQVPLSWIQRNQTGANSVLATGVRNPF